MHAASRIVQAILRVWQFICSVIVLGILARFLDVLSDAGVTRDGRIIYGIIVASISLVFAIVFVVPFLYSFLAFPFDFAMFVMWLVLFCLLITVSGSFHAIILDTHADFMPSAPASTHAARPGF